MLWRLPQARGPKQAPLASGLVGQRLFLVRILRRVGRGLGFALGIIIVFFFGLRRSGHAAQLGENAGVLFFRRGLVFLGLSRSQDFGRMQPALA